MPKPKPDLSEFKESALVTDLRRELYQTQRQLARAKDRKEAFVQATLAGARAAMLAVGPVPKVPKPKPDRRRGKPEVALWHLTDWQGAKVTRTYNSEVMRERVLLFAEKAERLTEVQRADHPVRGCMILFGGDLIEGLFNYPAQPYEIDATLFDQYVRAARLVADVVRRALATYEWVECIGEWGNHGRIGAKRAAVVPSDNVDRMVLQLAYEMLSGESRLTFHEPSSDDVHQVVIGNYKALLMHGDEVGRTGFASPTTLQRHVAQWQSGVLDFEFRDCYFGHFHNHCEYQLPNGRGSIYQTGSTESDNRYAGIGMAAAATPTQRLHFIDPEKGRVTAQYKVFLDA